MSRKGINIFLTFKLSNVKNQRKVIFYIIKHTKSDKSSLKHILLFHLRTY